VIVEGGEYGGSVSGRLEVQPGTAAASVAALHIHAVTVDVGLMKLRGAQERPGLGRAVSRRRATPPTRGSDSRSRCLIQSFEHNFVGWSPLILRRAARSAHLGTGVRRLKELSLWCDWPGQRSGLVNHMFADANA
jgi:hypothetical protein